MTMTIIDIIHQAIYIIRVFFVANVSHQVYELLADTDKQEAINESLNEGWTYQGACIKYLLLKNCQSLLPLIGMACCVSTISKLFHKFSLSFMLIDDDGSSKAAGTILGWLFVLLCYQNSLTSMKDDDARFLKLLKTLSLTLVASHHALFRPVNHRLQSLSASRSKSLHKHLRVLLFSGTLILFPALFINYLMPFSSFNSWVFIMVVSSVEMMFRISIALIIYTISMINSFYDVSWRNLEDHIYYLTALNGLFGYLCSLLLFCNGSYVLIFEGITCLRFVSLFVHFYFNIYSQARKGWEIFNKRRLAESKIGYLRNATRNELIELDDVCSICFQNLDDAKSTTCSHYFHADCLTRWLYLQDTCPLCFRQLFEKA